jgi:hypothetical protein
MVMLFNATFNNISVIWWPSVLLVKETGVSIKLVGGNSAHSFNPKCVLRSLVVLFWYSKSTISYTIYIQAFMKSDMDIN